MKKTVLIKENEKENFKINESKLTFELESFPIIINSFPKRYSVSPINNYSDYLEIIENADFIIIDKKVKDIYELPEKNKNKIFSFEAIEANKNMNTVLDLINLFIENNISKGSKVIAIGGGIVQDIAACACALFRRGQPFTYFPTTTLGQLDSCVGAKCAVNTKLAKNILGLFSAPKEVKIPIFAIETMPAIDHRAGLSEMLRLCLTASQKALNTYLDLLPYIINPKNLDKDKYASALRLSLSIKKSVVDFDEYEKDVRRSMNYGHTFGHAIEKLVNFKIPHGLGVLLGIHIANTFSFNKNFMSLELYNQISNAIKNTLKDIGNDFLYLNDIDPFDIIDQFKYDKKGDGKSVPLILIKKPGDMIFYKYSFDSKSDEIKNAIESSISEFIKWSID
tara:strand:+ start:1758 stop:2939 length:1182 start_codon:yes stop_codon:yes gene_type:complete